MKAVLDEMLPAEIARQLRRRGHDVIAVTERADLRGLGDADQVERARDEQRAIVTYDVEDHIPLARSLGERPHPGLILVSQRRFPQGVSSIGRLVSSLDTLLRQGEPYPAFVVWLA